MMQSNFSALGIYAQAQSSPPVNQRFVIVGIVLAIAVTAAFFIGSPMFGNFDMAR